MLQGDTIKEENEDSKVDEEEDSTEEEDRLFVIIVTSMGIWRGIVRILVQHTHVVEN
jgi:hypothetical protein